MKTKMILIGVFLASIAGTSCSSALYSSAGYNNDDLYALHDKTEIARKQQAEAEARKAEAEARRAEWEARLAEAQAAAAQNNYYKQTESPNLENVLADTYESAYARRLRGFESPTYRMPSSYFNFRYGTAFSYVSAYDPAFYNIVVSGDEVWVEPKYITSMFGSWGGTVYVDPWYYGWSRPYWNFWSPSFSIGSWGWSFGFNTWYHPWWHSGWYHHGHPHWHHHWAGPAWRPKPTHNYRLDSYNRGGSRNYRGSSYNNRGGSYNTGRGQKINDKQYNSRGNSGNKNKNNSYNSGRNNNNRGSSYNDRGSSYNSNRGSSYNSGGFGGSRSSGYSGGGNSGGGGRRYNSGR